MGVKRRMKLNYIGKRIGDYRRQIGLSQANVAEQIGVSVKYISAIETGHEIPSLDTLIAIADTLHQPPGNLFGELVSESYDYEVISELKGISTLSHKSQEKIYAVLEALLATSEGEEC